MALPLHRAELEGSLTSDEFEKLPEFEARYELIEGRPVEKPMAGYEHNRIARRIARAYDEFDPHEEKSKLQQETNVKIGPENTPAPDVLIWSASHRPTLTKKAGSRPDIAIEIWSPDNLDTLQHWQEAREKVRRYRQAGVPLVWAINPANQKVEVYQPDQVEMVERLDVNGVLSAEAVIPGFKLPVKMLFE